MAKRLNILIVEDEFISRILLQEMLVPFGDCRTATNGDDAVDVLRNSYDTDEGRYDLVCLDLMMPGKNGHEVLKELRKLETTKGVHGIDSTKVFIVSALDDAASVMETLVAGCCEAYLTKPVSRLKLEEKLRTLNLIQQEC